MADVDEILRRFDALPDSAVLPTKVSALILGLSEKTVRAHPKLPRRPVSRGRYGQSAGDIRRVARGEAVTFVPNTYGAHNPRPDKAI